MKYFLFISFLLLCGNAIAQRPLAEVKPLLVGRWDWTKTVVDAIGAHGGPSTPSTCHCEKYIVFVNDSVVNQYEKDSLVSSSVYSLHEFHFLNDPVAVNIWCPNLNGRLIMFSDSTMGIGAFGSCGSNNYYKKK